MSTDIDWSDVAATLGNDFHIARLTFKNHIGCGHTFAAINAVREIKRQFTLDYRKSRRFA